MAKILPGPGDNQFRVIWDSDDWFAGLDDTSAGTGARKIGDGLAFADHVNPLRLPGFMSPSALATDVTNVSNVTGIIKNGVVRGSSAYLIAQDKVHKLDSLITGSINTTSPFPFTLAHGAHTSIVGEDIVNYYTGSTYRAFFSLRDSDDWDIGIYNYVADTFDADFMSTAATVQLGAPYLTGGKSAPHPLIVGDDDVLYVGDRNFVHAYDGQVGAAGTFYPAVLTLPTGWVITSFSKTRDFKLAIGAFFSDQLPVGSTFNKGEAFVWMWNYLDLDPFDKYDLKDNYVSEIFLWRGRLAAFTSGRRSVTQAGNNKLQAIGENNEFEIVTSYTTGASLPAHGGVDVVHDDIYWNAAGKIYSYAKNPYTGAYAMHLIDQGTGGSSGMLKFFTNAREYHVSSGTTTSGGLQYFDHSAYDSEGTFYGKKVYPPFPPRMQGQVAEVTIVFQDAASGGRSIALNTDLDGTSSTTLAATASPGNQQITIRNKDGGTPIGKFASSIRPEFTWATGSGSSSAPQIERIEYLCEYTNV